MSAITAQNNAMSAPVITYAFEIARFERPMPLKARLIPTTKTPAPATNVTIVLKSTAAKIDCIFKTPYCLHRMSGAPYY